MEIIIVGLMLQSSLLLFGMWLQLGVVMWLQLGVVMLERGSHKEALQNFELALQFDPKHRVSFELFSNFVRICRF